MVAKRLGIKPGSAEFHRLKRGFVPTYDRWSRPISLDDDLRRAYPNRGKGHGNKPGKMHNGASNHDRGNGHGHGKGNNGKGNGKGRDHH